MKTFTEHLQDCVGATYPLEDILNNLSPEEIEEEAHSYAKEVAREALKNAADKYQEMMYYVVDETDDNIEGLLRLKRRTIQTCYAVPKQTVLGESNIPEL